MRDYYVCNLFKNLKILNCLEVEQYIPYVLHFLAWKTQKLKISSYIFFFLSILYGGIKDLITGASNSSYPQEFHWN